MKPPAPVTRARLPPMSLVFSPSPPLDACSRSTAARLGLLRVGGGIFGERQRSRIATGVDRGSTIVSHDAPQRVADAGRTERPAETGEHVAPDHRRRTRVGIARAPGR